MSSFSDLKLSQDILKAVNEAGFTEPTPIQIQTLPILLGEPTDFVGLAGTGTGKTAAFSLPMLERLDRDSREVQTLILCPTRELALQVTGQVSLLGKYKGVRAVPVYGGSSYGDQIRGLKSGAQVVIGTPGRVVDHLERGTLKLENLKTLILDEADEMFSMGFKEELEKILNAFPAKSCNTWLFSATMSPQVSRITETYLKSPKSVQINRKELLSENVEQLFYPVRESDKPEVLTKLIEAADDFYGVIFCQTKALVVDLTSYLIDKGYKADSLHGDKDQNSRERTMQAFRDRRLRILVCTDVASRGLDVKDITHVVNYSLPREMDNYVHRIGRTARSGKTGIAMNLVTKAHRPLIARIERFTKSRMVEGKIPGRRDIAFKKVAAKLPAFTGEAWHERALEVMGEEWLTAIKDMPAQEVAARFIAMSMPEIFGERESAPTPRPTTPAAAPERRRFEERPQQRREEPRFEKRRFDDQPQQRREERRYDGPPRPRFKSRDEAPAREGDYPPRPRFKAGPKREFNRDQKRNGAPKKFADRGSTKLGKTYPTAKRREYDRTKDANVRPRST